MLKEMQKNASIAIIAGVILVAIIILVTSLAKSSGEVSDPVSEEDVVEEMESDNDYSRNSEGTIAQLPMAPIEDGEFYYSFKDINWIFEIAENTRARVPETRVSFEFDSFSRRESQIPATFGRPFYIGWYQGECEKMDVIDENPLQSFGIPVALAQCQWEGETTSLVTFQEDRILSVYHKTVDANWELVRELDMATLVQ